MLILFSTFPCIAQRWSGERGSIGCVHHLDWQGLEAGVMSSDLIIQAGHMMKHRVHEQTRNITEETLLLVSSLFGDVSR